MDFFSWIDTIYRDLGFSAKTVANLGLLTNIIFIIIAAYLIDFIAKKILTSIISTIANRTKTSFDDFLVNNNTAKYIAHLFPLYFIYTVVPILLDKYSTSEKFLEKGLKIYIILLFLWIIRSVFRALRDYLKQKPRYKDKPIDSYIQVVTIVLWMFGLFSFISILFNVETITFLTAFGSISAIIILVFRDTILGFVASITVSVNDMVRIGDWITIDKFGADGDVIEINLATVKVRNFDNTTTTIPTYSLISDSFKNWRGMQKSDGRRIKRNILIKPSSVKFIENNQLDYFRQIQELAHYIDHRQTDIDKYNENNAIDKSLLINGRNLTNLGLFRKYITQYLQSHPGVNKEMMLMVRHLQPTEKGIPIEIYCFSKDKVWENYEHIMADIFDHIIASVNYFELELLELNFTTS